MANQNLTIQIYGERCSGTNYLEQLLVSNFPTLRIAWDYGWKHFFHKEGVESASGHIFVVIYRNPFDWIKSLHKHPWHTAHHLRGISLSRFIRHEWQCIWDEDAEKTPDNPLYGTEMIFERCPVTGNRFSNVLKMRSAKIRNWESLKGKVDRVIYMRYEDLISCPEKFIEKISVNFNIWRMPSLQNVESYKGMGPKYKPALYNPLSRDDIEFIVQELDESLEASIGYNLKELAQKQNSAD